MSVNLKVDSPFALLDVPGLSTVNQKVWKIRLMKITGRSPALAALSRWAETVPYDFKAIMTAMRLVCGQRSIPSLPYIGKTVFPEIHELRATEGTARLQFFYDRRTGTVVCTKDYEEGESGDSRKAAALSETLRKFYLEWPVCQIFP